MPKVGMRAVRRSQLVNAAVELIEDHGIAGTSVSLISAKAGLATGMVHHYFADKNALLEATLWELVRRLTRQIYVQLAEARTPTERVLAFVDGNLCPASLTPRTVSVWLSFWGQVPHNPRFARIHNIIARRTQAALARTLAECMPREEAVRHAKVIVLFVDGLWLRAAIDPEGMTGEVAMQTAHDFLQRQLGAAFKRPVTSTRGKRPGENAARKSKRYR
jgi:TetR/AcrR family transcriptional regulator, transcriptional repressor of bet genes